MGIFNNWVNQTRKPEGFLGKMMIKGMNSGHAKMADWGLDILVPGHTWGHMVYLIDDKYLFTGDTIWFDPRGGCSFLDNLAEDNALSIKSLAALERLLRGRGLKPIVITGHTGWSDDLDFVFAHTDTVCRASRKQKPHDPNAPYDAYDESKDTKERAQTVRLKKALPVTL